MVRHLSAAEILVDYLAAVGRAGSVDLDMLESIVSRATAVDIDKEADLHRVAAALLEGICRRQPFIDGNRDVALRSVRRLYTLNGTPVDHLDGQLVPLIADIANGRLGLDESARQLRSLLSRSPS